MTSVTSQEAVPVLADAVLAVPRSSWRLVGNGSVDSEGGKATDSDPRSKHVKFLAGGISLCAGTHVEARGQQ